MIIIFFYFFFIISNGKFFYLTDNRYPIPDCNIEFSSVVYNLKNIMGTIEITNDPLVENLIFNIYLSTFLSDNLSLNISSCGLCQIYQPFCFSPPQFILSQDVYFNFIISVKKYGYGQFYSREGLQTKYKLQEGIILKIPLETLLNHNNDSITNLSCDDKLEFIIDLIISTNNDSVIQREFVLSPINLIVDSNNDIGTDTYNILCINNEEYLTNFDCSQSDVYRVNKYTIENCLIEKPKTINHIYDNLILPPSNNCSFHDNIYYDSILFNNIPNNFSNDITKICNQSFDYIFKNSIYDENNLYKCEQILIECDYNDYYDNQFYNGSILLKPFYRLYKETIMLLLNYLSCLSKNNTKIMEIEKLLHYSIGILKNSCFFKDTLEIDYKEYQHLIYQLYILNINGKDHCLKCNDFEMKCIEEFYFCKYIIDSYKISKKSIESFYESNIEKYLNEDSNQDQQEDEDLLQNNTSPFIEIFKVFLEKNQYNTGSVLLFLFISLIFILIFGMICMLCIQKCILIMLNRNNNQ
jgi:hypothetical protein